MTNKLAATAVEERHQWRRPADQNNAAVRRPVRRRGIAAVELLMLFPVLAMLLVRVVALQENSVGLIGALLCVGVYLISRLCIEPHRQ